MLQTRSIEDEWQIAEGINIPKEKGAKTLGQFRPISLLNVEGKIPFAIMASQLYTYLTMNDYMTRAWWMNLVDSPRLQFTPYAHSTLKGSGPCLSDASFNEHRVMSYLADTQAT